MRRSRQPSDRAKERCLPMPSLTILRCLKSLDSQIARAKQPRTAKKQLSNSPSRKSPTAQAERSQQPSKCQATAAELKWAHQVSLFHHMELLVRSYNAPAQLWKVLRLFCKKGTSDIASKQPLNDQPNRQKNQRIKTNKPTKL